MIPYHYELIGNIFNDNLRHIAFHNNANILGDPLDTTRIMRQLNGHIEALKSSKPFDKAYDYKSGSFNNAFTHNKPEYCLGDKFQQHELLKTRYRPNLFGIEDLRPLLDPVYRYHMSIGGGYERSIIKYYNLLEGEYYNRLFFGQNVDMDNIDG